VKWPVGTRKWEGTIQCLRNNGQRFTARVVITPRRDAQGRPLGLRLISKDISEEIRLTEEPRRLKEKYAVTVA